MSRPGGASVISFQEAAGSVLTLEAAGALTQARDDVARRQELLDLPVLVREALALLEPIWQSHGRTVARFLRSIFKTLPCWPIPRGCARC